MSQSEPSITRTFFGVLDVCYRQTNDRKVWVACESESAAAAELEEGKVASSSVNVTVAPVAVRVGSSLTSSQ